MRIAILGAYGFSGQLIGEALVAAGFHPILAGRDKPKLNALALKWGQGLEQRVVHLENPNHLESLFSEIDILIQTAGPYTTLPAVFTQALSLWPGICLDVCGEYDFVEQSIQNHESTVTLKGGLRLHSCGFESIPAMWLAEKLLSGGWKASRFATFYSHKNPKFSPGTRNSARLISSQPKRIFAEGILRNANREEWVSKSIVPKGFIGDSALLSPLPEMIFVPRRYGVQYCGSYALIPEEAARFLDAGTTMESSMKKSVSHRPRSIPNALERSKHDFIVTATAWNEAGETRFALLQGHDPYGTTAWLVRRVIEILNLLEIFPVGILSPEEVFPADLGLKEVVDNLGFHLELG